MTTVALNGKKKKSLKSRLIDQKYLFLLMIPGVIWVLVICYAPMSGLYMAFTNYRPTQAGYFADLFGAKFVGFQWFEYFFSKDFGMIMRNTLATSVLTLLFSFPAPIILAVMLNELRSVCARTAVIGDCNKPARILQATRDGMFAALDIV